MKRKHSLNRSDQRAKLSVSTENNSKRRKQKMSSERSFEFSISKGNLKDALIPMLLTLGFVHHDEEIIDIDFNTTALRSNTMDIIPIAIKLKKEQEVEV